MSEKFSVKRLLKSPLDPMYWVTVLSLVIPYIVIGLLALGVYNKFFKRNDSQKVIAKEGSTVNLYQDRKRFMIPFIEGFSEIGDNGSSGFDFGARAGLRIEF